MNYCTVAGITNECGCLVRGIRCVSASRTWGARCVSAGCTFGWGAWILVAVPWRGLVLSMLAWLSSISTWSAHRPIITFLLVGMLDLSRGHSSEDDDDDSPDLPNATEALRRRLLGWEYGLVCL